MQKLAKRLVLPFALAATIGTLGLHSATAQTKKGKDAPKATFELYKDNSDEFRFRLKDDEGTLLAISSKGYKTKGDVTKVIDSIKASAAKAKLDDQSK